MNWFIEYKLIETHFDGFMNDRLKELSIVDAGTSRQGLHIKPLTNLCRLIFTNRPVADTCRAICERSGDCPERSSNYCQIITNRDSKYDRTDWRRQAAFFYKAIKKYEEPLTRIIGSHRINYFIAQIVDLGKENLKQIKRSDREEFIKSYGNLPDIDLLPVTIQDMDSDPWENYLKKVIKKEEHLLTCSQ